MLKAWNTLWFTLIDARQYAVLRILFGGLSCGYFLSLLPYVESQFSRLAWLKDIQQIANQNGGSWSVFFINAPWNQNTLAYLFVGLGVITAFLMMIGWQSRYNTLCLASTILSGSRQLPWPVFVEKWATFLNSVFFDNCLLRFQ